MLPVYVHQTLQSFDLCPTLLFQKLRHAWEEEIDASSPLFFISIDPQYLHFVAKFSSHVSFDHSLPAGFFQEGLWNQEVLELFLVEDGGKAYQEINLSPAGAWWTCGFSEYRKRITPTPTPLPSAKVKLKRESTHILVELRLSRAELLVNNSLGPTSRANVSAMHAGTAQSWASISTQVPDFHVVTSFEEIELRPL